MIPARDPHPSAKRLHLAPCPQTFAPTIAITEHQTVTPGTKDLSLTTFAPTVTIADHKTVIPSTGALTLTTFAPTITTTANQTITPGHVTLIFTMYAPTVTAGEKIHIFLKCPALWHWTVLDILQLLVGVSQGIYNG